MSVATCDNGERQIYSTRAQAAMVFQVIVPKQLRDIEIGRHRLQFLYRAPRAFAHLNLPTRLGQMKSDEGFAQVAGVELTHRNPLLRKAVTGGARLCQTRLQVREEGFGGSLKNANGIGLSQPTVAGKCSINQQ